jgi:hypothetical protein
MGEASEREYDTIVIFKHLYVHLFESLAHQMHPIYRCFYVDSPENGRKNEMVVNTKYEKEISDQCVPLIFRQNEWKLMST